MWDKVVVVDDDVTVINYKESIMYQHCIDGYLHYKTKFMIYNQRAKLYRNALNKQAAWISDKYIGDIESTISRLSTEAIRNYRRSLRLIKYYEENK
jgi:hypothetical protein